MAPLCAATFCFTTVIALTGSLFGLKHYDKKRWHKIEDTATMFIGGKVTMKEPQGMPMENLIPEETFRAGKTNIAQENEFLGKRSAPEVPEEKILPENVMTQEKVSRTNEHATCPKKPFRIEGFEALKMSAGPMFERYHVPDDRFNGRFAFIGKSSDGRPIFEQQGQMPFWGQGRRRIAWFDGHWRYYSYFDYTSKAGADEKCTFMVKSNAKHPLDIPQGLMWTVHTSAVWSVKAHGFSATSPNFKVQVHADP
mmetsp:Transcript_94407/g.177729  ORF Transcript_94407/g.177729 Transcript_94407/m.177729 type:complete len:253 (+) Transcript_94407:73-831(+)